MAVCEFYFSIEVFGVDWKWARETFARQWVQATASGEGVRHAKHSRASGEAERETIQGKKVFETLAKYYFEDWGLRNAIVGYNPADRSKLMENMVFMHLLICGYKVTVGVEGNREIDFVATKDNETIYVQVTYMLGDEKTVKREFGNLLAVKDNYPKFVVSMDPFSGNSYKGIKHVRLREFLSNCF